MLAIGIDNVLDGRFSMGREHRITSAKYERLKKFTARPLDVLITVMATVGRVCVLPENLEKAIITKHCYRISPPDRFVNSHYLAFTLRADAPTRQHKAGAGEKIRRALLERCDVHTLLRLPTGIWYSPGVKANVLLFDKKPAAKTPWTKEMWVYDLRTNKNFTLRQNPIGDDDLKEFVESYRAANRLKKREEFERFKRFTYADLMARDKANLDISWLKDDSLADTKNLPKPAVLATEIIEDLEEALEEFSAVEREMLE